MEANRAFRIDSTDPTGSAPPSMHHWLVGVAQLLSAVGGAVAIADQAGRLLVMSRRLELVVGALPETTRRRWLADLREKVCAFHADGLAEQQAHVAPWHTRLAAVAFPSSGHTVVRIELARHACLPAELRALLSRREADVAAELIEGHSSRVVAQHLGVTVHTIRRMTERVFKKVGVHSRSELTLRALGIASHARLLVAKPDGSQSG